MEKRLNRWKDSLGILASVICAIHCAATPILLALLPTLTLTEWMSSPRFHQIAAVVCVGMVSLAIWPAFRRFRDYSVLSLSSAGLGLLIAAAFFLPDECCSHSIAGVAGSVARGQDGDPSDVSHNHPLLGSPEQDLRDAPLTVFTASVVSPELIAIVQPWMTPLGGLLLVIAHGLNLRLRVCSNSRCVHSSSAADRAERGNRMLAVVNSRAA
jgi:hypothetical protein